MAVTGAINDNNDAVCILLQYAFPPTYENIYTVDLSCMDGYSAFITLDLNGITGVYSRPGPFVGDFIAAIEDGDVFFGTYTGEAWC